MSKIIKYVAIDNNPMILKCIPPVIEVCTATATVANDSELQESRQMAEDIINEAREQAAACLTECNKEVEQIREQTYHESYQQGYQEGLAQGREEGLKQSQDTLQHAENEAAQMIITAKEQSRAMMVQAERQIVELALTVARKILAREIEENPMVILPIVQAALAKVSDQPQATIKVGEADYDLLQQAKADLLKKAGINQELTVVVDPSIPPGGCIVSTPFGVVDARIDTQFQALTKALQEVLP